MNKGKEKIYNILDELNIKYIKHEHEAVYTIEEVNNLQLDIEGQHCKNLFLRNRKGNIHYLLILCDEKMADLKALAKEIGSTPLSMASEERLYKHLELTPGSVTPFGLINNSDKKVKVLLDKDLKHDGKINFHPNTNTATLTINYEDFHKFLQWTGNEVIEVHV
ncbi:prolyl-tRNA synthetase associated domain-containing protein [Clostridium botulinum]|uniref:prolyl-tRNA synthetase associated domain-containing protein n=1 Tax=Clostridium botulinum TaxID=1491 RepID=UPI00174E0187|nr:prolyl-tRNA synthetase associated domain-containing protein [Clostridium botulinum]MBD5640478.1 prolyl-tRNA synthetase associated domain-containing protein [Clostridium botulinum]